MPSFNADTMSVGTAIIREPFTAPSVLLGEDERNAALATLGRWNAIILLLDEEDVAKLNEKKGPDDLEMFAGWYTFTPYRDGRYDGTGEYVCYDEALQDFHSLFGDEVPFHE